MLGYVAENERTPLDDGPHFTPGIVYLHLGGTVQRFFYHFYVSRQLLNLND